MGRVHVLVGTRKGAWVYRADEKREHWEVSDPMLAGCSVYQMELDSRGSEPRIFAASNHWAWGRSVARSDDWGETWEQRTPGLSFAEPSGLSVENVWSLCLGHVSEPGVVYAGTQPAGLFRSEDRGETWAAVEAFNNHPARSTWSMSGGGDSAVHTVEVDPRDARHMYVSISTGGTFETRDGGSSWVSCAHNAVATTPAAKVFLAFIADNFPIPEGVDPAAGDEFHKFRVDQKNPARLWGQAHTGVFRSDDGGESWKDMTEGLPSFHGFPIAVTRRVPDRVFVVPLEFQQNNFRVCPGQFAVYRTEDAGSSWQRLTNGLPGPNDFQSIYRDAMDTDGMEQEGVYLGTTNGQVYYGRNGGEEFIRLPGTLPPILSVRAIEVG